VYRNIPVLVDIVQRAAGPCDADVEFPIRHFPCVRQRRTRHIDVGGVDYLVVSQAEGVRQTYKRTPRVGIAGKVRRRWHEIDIGDVSEGVLEHPS
jgi:hypothetical protein